MHGGRYNRNVLIAGFVHRLHEPPTNQIDKGQLLDGANFNSPLSPTPRSSTGLELANMAGRLASSVFVGFVLESLLYGAFIMIFIAAAVTQRERWRHEKLKTGNKLVMGFSILLLGFISTVSVSRVPLDNVKRVFKFG